LPEEFGESLDKMMSEMAILMYHSNGVGLAGPQVGSDLRILVADMGYVAGGAYGKELIKMVNPVLVSQSDFLVKAEEQCLSYPGLKVNVERANEITVKYLTPLGEERQDTYKDWQARVVLHEMEHLDGVNLYSRSSSLKKKRYDEMLKKKAK
jgi:peptide deformylase